MGKRGPKLKQPVAIEWTPKIAYAVGLLASDGNLSKDGRHIDFTSKDKELVQVFRESIKTSAPISRKGRGGSQEKKYYRVQISSVGLYRWLESIGLTPAKSGTLSSLDIPDEYFFDFFRGCFDGDGSLHAFWDRRWKSSFMFYLYIAGASPVFLRWLQDTIKRLSGVQGTISSGKNRRAEQLQFAKSSTRKLALLMYYGDVPHLRRKFTKLQKIFKIDDGNARVLEPVDRHA